MQNLFNLKKKWVSTDAWRGYEEPINAVCGANNTGNWDDSPAPSAVCHRELDMAKKILIKNKIPYQIMVCNTSNVFCVHEYLGVPGRLKRRARKVLADLPGKTWLLYLC